MEVNYMLVVAATTAQFILGAVWYSPLLFGRWWMEIFEKTHLSPSEMKDLQKGMGAFYALQIFLTFFTTVSFANLVPYISAFGIYHIAFWIWIGFVAPVQIGTVIWGGTKKKFWPKQIFVMITYQLVGMMLMAYILSL